MSLFLTLPNVDEGLRLVRQDNHCASEDIALTHLISLKRAELGSSDSTVEVYKAKMSGNTAELQDVTIKLSFDDDAFEALEREAGYYDTHLLRLLSNFNSTSLFLIVHDNLNASHILDFHGKPFIVDFTCAEEHDYSAGSRKDLWAKEGDVFPDAFSLRCYEIWEFLKSLETFWLPNKLTWLGLDIRIVEVNSAAYLYERGHWERVPKDCSKERIWDDAVVAWKCIHDIWEKYHRFSNGPKPSPGNIDYKTYLRGLKEGESTVVGGGEHEEVGV
ncbi:hypothetical protein DXG01_000528 [Tephrocybe rancida]|nr:hypothetical protein DXG01_000528 [Tephrocybe rancida]